MEAILGNTEYRFVYQTDDGSEQLYSAVAGVEMRPINPDVARQIFDLCSRIASTSYNHYCKLLP
jgi:hypothetical protein